MSLREGEGGRKGKGEVRGGEEGEEELLPTARSKPNEKTMLSL